jgi:predicted MFS family arabinose efflux permease
MASRRATAGAVIAAGTGRGATGPRLGHNGAVPADRESLANPRLWLAFTSMLLVSGIANTFPVFLPALLAEFGGSRGTTAAAASLLWVGGALLGPLAGWLVARWNPRLTVAIGLVATALGLGLGALAPTLPLFVLAVGTGGGIGVGLTGLVTQATLLADTYVRRRGLAMGIAFSGSMAAYVLSAPAQWAIDLVGWRGALGGYVAALALMLPWAWATLPARLGAGAAPGGARSSPLRRLVGSVPFWSLAVVTAVPPLFGYLATTQHALYLAELGYSLREASLMLAVGGVLSASGRALVGLLADRVGAARAGLASFACSLAGIACLLGLEGWPGRPLAYAYVLLVFLPLGSRATIFAVLLGRITTPASYGPVFGVLGIGNSLGAALGPWLSGALHDWTGGYRATHATAFGLAVTGLGALVVFLATTREPGTP